jgi:hypothetical protein
MPLYFPHCRRLGPFDDERGNAVDDGVSATAGAADQARTFRVQITMAGRAS